MSYILSSSFTGLALQQLLSMSAKKPGALLAKLALIQRVGQQPPPEGLEALQQKVSSSQALPAGTASCKFTLQLRCISCLKPAMAPST